MARKKSARQSLAEYQAKRNFARTPEPTGKERGRNRKAPLSFCVQKHLASHLHYDFRLEYNGVLLSWAVPKGPSLNPADKRLAMKVEDHPLDYGEFEGVIPEGYGAGIVMLWDRGTWRPLVEDVDATLEKGELKFTLDGVKLKGSWVLVRTGGRYGASGRAWLLIKHRDEWAGEVDIATFAPLSARSFGDFDDILAKEKPDIWKSHRPAEGGAAGKIFEGIIKSAVRKKLARAEGKKVKKVGRKKVKTAPKRTKAKRAK